MGETAKTDEKQCRLAAKIPHSARSKRVEATLV
jgi:hypothetical protein